MTVTTYIKAEIFPGENVNENIARVVDIDGVIHDFIVPVEFCGACSCKIEANLPDRDINVVRVLGKPIVGDEIEVHVEPFSFCEFR